MIHVRITHQRLCNISVLYSCPGLAKKKEAGGYFPKGDRLKKIGGPSLVFGYAPKINKK